MQTTDPSLKSFVSVSSESHFPIQNLPYGVFRTSTNATPRIGVAIGDFVCDLSILEDEGLFTHPDITDKKIFHQPNLNGLMSLGRPVWSDVRKQLTELLNESCATLRDNSSLKDRVLVPRSDAELLLPVKVNNYTDFYSSREHATNVGTMFRGPENALMPNWLHLPVAYHGRANTVILSGEDVRRPCGQRKAPEAKAPTFGPTKRLDYELEMGFFVGPGNEREIPIPIAKAADHIFGMVIVNDWSARDIQAWEYQPLGPFLAKSFATSISPWVVPLEALEPFRMKGPEQTDPEPLDYLKSCDDRAYDINLEVSIQTDENQEPMTICRSNLKYMYWNICQQLAHHTVNGCKVEAGDMLASGTISGPDKSSRGSLLESTWRGEEPIEFPDGSIRTFLQNGDRVTMSGFCQGEGFRVGFGEVTAKILPARSKKSTS